MDTPTRTHPAPYPDSSSLPSSPPPSAARPSPLAAWTPPPPPPTPPQDHPRGTLVLVLGILSVTGLMFLGPLTWSLGSRALQEADAAPFPTANRSVLEHGTRLGRWATYAMAVLVMLMSLFTAVTITLLG